MRQFCCLSLLVALVWGFTRHAPPRLFVIGDSISIQYGPFLKKSLGDRYEYDRKRRQGQARQDLDQAIGANGGDSRRVLNYVKWLQTDSIDFEPDVILLNCGLHDIKTTLATGERQVETQEYEDNLRQIVSICREERWPLVFANTTPAIDSIHNKPNMQFHRHAADVKTYNAIAERVMREFYVPIIDLHSFSANLPPDAFKDHVHYQEPYRERQADFIAGHLLAWINRW